MALCFASGGEGWSDEHSKFLGGFENPCVWTGAVPSWTGACGGADVATDSRSHRHDQSVNTSGPANAALRAGNLDAGKLWVGGRYFFGDLVDNADHEVLQICPTGTATDVLCLGVKQVLFVGNFLQFYNRKGDLWVAVGPRGTTNLLFITWTVLEMEVTPTHVKAWVNGALELDFDHGLNIGSIVQASKVWWVSKSNPAPPKGEDYWFRKDDLVILDDTGTKFNQRPTSMFRVINAMPLGVDASNNQWTGVPDNVNKHLNVDEQLMDITDYISSGVAGQYQLFDLQSRTSIGRCNTNRSAAAINAAVVWCDKSGSGLPILAARESATLRDGPLNDGRAQGFPVQAWYLEKSPDGNDWTWPIFDASFFGVKTREVGGPNVVVCGAMVLIEGAGYDAPPPPAGAKRRHAGVF